MIAPNHSLTILIVDDNATDRTTYRRYLLEASARQYAIVEAESGEQGLQLCRRQNPDVILLDFLLPDFDGLEFFTELKAQANGSTPAVVMLTGQGNERIAVQAIKSGIQDYLVKEETNREALQQAVFSAWEANYLRQKLQKSEERFRTSVENLMDCFGIYSAVRDYSGRIVDFRVEYVNRAACEANRMTQEQQVGKRLCELLPAHRETGLFDEYCRVVETGTPLAKDFCLYSDEFNGQALARFFDIRASKLGDGFVASWRDVTERKLTEKALEQQARLIELTSEAIIASDADSAIATWNRGAEEMYGQTKEEATGKITHTLLQTQFPQPREDLDAILTEQGHWEGELIHTRKDGTQIVVESRQVIVRDEGGKPIGFLEVNRDISDRKLLETERERAQEALRQSEQRYRAIFNTTFQFIGLMQLDGTLIEANQTALDFGGLQRSDAIGRPFWEARWWKNEVGSWGDRPKSGTDVGAQGTCCPPSEDEETRDNQSKIQNPKSKIPSPKQEQLREAIQRAARGEFVRYEVEVLGANDRIITIDFSIKPVFDDLGQVVLLIPEGRDISDRIHAENLLKISERRIASLAKLSPVGIFRSDRDGSCIYVNDRTCEITGLAPEQSHGMNWVSAIHPDDQERVLSEWQQAVENRLLFRSEYRYLHADGTVRWVIGQAMPEIDEHEQIIGYIGTLTDISARQRVEEALRLSEEQHRLALDLSNLGSWDWNPKTNEVLWNDNHFYLLGLKPDEAQSSYQTWRDRVHPEDIERVEQALSEAQATRTDYQAEYRIVRPDGNVRWLLGKGRALYDETGEPVRMIGIILDISDRQRTEQRLLESEERLQLSMQVAGFAIAKFDYASNTVELSPQAAALYGLPPSELIVPRSRIHATFHPEEREQLARIIEQVLDPAGTGWFARDHRVVWPNGEVRWLSVRKQVFFERESDSPRPIYAILAAIDISDRKRVEQDLQESKERLRTLADNMSQLAWIADESGWIFWYNQRWYEYTGTTLEEMQGWGWQKVHHPEHIERVVEYIRHCFETGELWEDTFPLRGRDGIYRWFLSRAIPIKDDRGGIRYWFGTNTNIDDLKQAEIQLQQQASELRQLNATLEQTTAQLAERNQELDRFTHTVSHDLKAPLRAIANLSQWLYDDLDGQLDAENQRNLELLQQRVARMEALINGLLTYSRIGRTEVPSETVNVGELISEILDSLAPPPSFTISVAPQMPTIVTKRLLLSQVFSNLISNAIKYCDPRSASAGNRPDGRIEISAIQKGQYYEFSVADNGIGIAPEDRDRIFGIFQTLKERDTQESTGIGLSIVKKIIETEGGAITVESRLGEGATFRFTWLNKPLSE
ncbi:MAG: PAS domain S-box protein [Hydrococcus sp. Prado102]|jgi:PAS domain S-box-containing protein|nr:PAS domain S-box protein [Hydrococcus sp. Prado102]